MTAEFWVTVVAIVVGPVLAVLISQQMQSRERKRDRQLFVLRSLLSTRKSQLSPDRVVALNLVELEFSGNVKILEHFQELMKVYSDTRWESEDRGVLKKVNEEVDRKSIVLIHEIAKALGYKFEQMNLLEGGYYPRGYGIAEEQQQIIREFFVGMREGKLFLPVALLDARHPEKVLEQSEEALRVFEAARIQREKDDP